MEREEESDIYRPALSTHRALHYLRPKVYIYDLGGVECRQKSMLIVVSSSLKALQIVCNDSSVQVLVPVLAFFITYCIQAK